MSWSTELFSFLSELAENNDRQWFEANKARWHRVGRDPALALVRDLAAPLAEAFPGLQADPRPVGGSLFRIYRDTRFSKDKRPYKTHLGIQLRAPGSKDVHHPGLYLHFEPGGCFVGAGLWRPEPPLLARLRAAMVADPSGWLQARDQALSQGFRLEGEVAARLPRGYAADPALADDLKRKDLLVVRPLPDRFEAGPALAEELVRLARPAAPWLSWLSRASAGA